MSVKVARFGMHESRQTHLIPNVCSCHVLRILAVAVCKIGDVCCLPAPAHQPFSSNSLDLSAPEEAYSRNVRAPGKRKRTEPRTQPCGTPAFRVRIED